MLKTLKLPKLSKKSKIKIKRVWSKLKAKKLFPNTIIEKTFEINSSFPVK